MRSIVLFAMFCVVIGCGGGGTGQGSTASMSLLADFAPATRTVPGYASEIRIVITPPAGLQLPPGIVNPIVLNRSTTSSLLLGLPHSELPYNLQMAAYTDNQVVGTAARSVIVDRAIRKEVDVSANLQSAIAAIVVEGAGTVIPGQAAQLTAHAENAQGATLFSGDGFTWTTSNSSAVSVDADGMASGGDFGEATITAHLRDSSLQGQKLVTNRSLIKNGFFETVFRPTCSESLIGISAYPAAALHWEMRSGANATVTTQILPTSAPGRTGNMLRWTTTQGQSASVNGSALAQFFPNTSNIRFESDIFVVQGTVMLGPVLTSGPFCSQTTYTPNGQWRHIVIDCPDNTETIAFQNVGAVLSNLEILVDNVKAYSLN
jgi:hypothetical protein